MTTDATMEHTVDIALRVSMVDFSDPRNFPGQVRIPEGEYQVDSDAGLLQGPANMDGIGSDNENGVVMRTTADYSTIVTRTNFWHRLDAGTTSQLLATAPDARVWGQYVGCCRPQTDQLAAGDILYLPSEARITEFGPYGSGLNHIFTPYQVCGDSSVQDCRVDLANQGGGAAPIYALDYLDGASGDQSFSNMAELSYISGVEHLDWDNTGYLPSTDTDRLHYPVVSGYRILGGQTGFLDAGYDGFAFMFEKRPTWQVPMWTNWQAECDNLQSAPALSFYDSQRVELDALITLPNGVDADDLLPQVLPGPWIDAANTLEPMPAHVDGITARSIATGTQLARIVITIDPAETQVGSGWLAVNVYNALHKTGGVDCLLSFRVVPDVAPIFVGLSPCGSEIFMPANANQAWTFNSQIEAAHVVPLITPLDIAVRPDYQNTDLGVFDFSLQGTDGDPAVYDLVIGGGIAPGTYRLQFNATNTLNQTTTCTFDLTALSQVSPSFLNCSGESIKAEVKRFQVETQLAELDILFLPDPNFPGGIVQVDLGDILYNDQPLDPNDPDDIEKMTAFQGTRMVLPAPPHHYRFILSTSGPPSSGTYKVQVVAWNSQSLETVDCWVTVTVKPVNPPSFIDPSPCTHLKSDFKLDTLPDVYVRFGLHAKTVDPDVNRFPDLEFELTGLNAAGMIVSTTAGNPIHATIQMQPPSEGDWAFTYQVSDDEGAADRCTVWFRSTPRTWVADQRTDEGLLLVGDDPGLCSLYGAPNQDARSALRFHSEPITDRIRFNYTTDVADLLRPRILGDVALNDDGRVVIAGGGERFIINGECHIVPHRRTMLFEDDYSAPWGRWTYERHVQSSRLAPILENLPGGLVFMGGDREGGKPYVGFHTPNPIIERFEGGKWKVHEAQLTAGVNQPETMPAGVVGASGVVTDGRLVVAGGFGHPQVPLSLVQTADASGAWESPMIPTETAAGRIFACDDKTLFMVGGTRGPFNRLYQADDGVSHVWQSTDGGDTWAFFQSLPRPLSYFAGDVSQETGLALLHGGYLPDAPTAPSQAKGAVQSALYALDCNGVVGDLPPPIEDIQPDPGLVARAEWRPFTSLTNVVELVPPALAEHAAGFSGGQFFTMGGTKTPFWCVPGSLQETISPTPPGILCDKASNACKLTRDVFRFDPRSHVWAYHDEIPTHLPGVAGMGYGVHRGLDIVALAGGRTGDALNNCWQPVDEAWLYLPFPISGAAADAGLAAMQGICPSCPQDVVHDLFDDLHDKTSPSFSLQVREGGLWLALPDLPEGLIHPGLAWLGEDLYVFGGDETGKDNGAAKTTSGGPMEMRPSREVYVLRHASTLLYWSLIVDTIGPSLVPTPVMPSWIKVAELPLPVVAPMVHGDEDCFRVFGGHHAPRSSARLVQTFAPPAPEECAWEDQGPGPSILTGLQEEVDDLVQPQPPQPTEWRNEVLAHPRAHHELIISGDLYAIGGTCGFLYSDGPNPPPERRSATGHWTSDGYGPGNALPPANRAYPAVLVDDLNQVAVTVTGSMPAGFAHRTGLPWELTLDPPPGGIPWGGDCT